MPAARARLLTICQIASRVIGRLEPRPGRPFGGEDPVYIIPDIYVYKVGDDLHVVLNEDGLPKLRINQLYRDVLARGAEIVLATGEGETLLTQLAAVPLGCAANGEPGLSQVLAAIGTALRAQRVADLLNAQGITPRGGSPREFAEFLAAERARWRDVVARFRQAGAAG